jgi:hypothetical protein
MVVQSESTSKPAGIVRAYVSFCNRLCRISFCVSQSVIFSDIVLIVPLFSLPWRKLLVDALHRNPQFERTLTSADEVAGYLAPEDVVLFEESTEHRLGHFQVESTEKMAPKCSP